MAVQGPNSPGTAVNDASIGTQAWTNPENVVSSNDLRASCANSESELGNYLKVTNFGFTIPAGSTIDGIEVIVERMASGNGNTEDLAARIVKGGTIGSTARESAGNWPVSDTDKTYGGPSDLWGETWDVDDINSSTFGFAIACQETEGKSDPDTGAIDHIEINVYYTPPPAEPAPSGIFIHRRFNRPRIGSI